MSVPPEQAITLKVEDTIATITLNLPKKLNALTQDLYFRISCLLQEVAKMDQVVITILTGNGRFFSAGADVTVTGQQPAPDMDPRRVYLQNFVANNLNTTRAFYTHPKILVAALNGPAVGLSAALLGHADFVYAAPHTYLLTPFTSLGLVAEGGSSRALMRRLGDARGGEALYMSKRISCEELVQCGFINKVFDCKPGDSDTFLKQVVHEVKDRLGPHLNPSSIINMKRLIRRSEVEELERVGVDEVMEGLDRFAKGYPQEEFRKLASGEKKHKL